MSAEIIDLHEWQRPMPGFNKLVTAARALKIALNREVVLDLVKQCGGLGGNLKTIPTNNWSRFLAAAEEARVKSIATGSRAWPVHPEGNDEDRSLGIID